MELFKDVQKPRAPYTLNSSQSFTSYQHVEGGFPILTPWGNFKHTRSPPPTPDIISLQLYASLRAQKKKK